MITLDFTNPALALRLGAGQPYRAAVNVQACARLHMRGPAASWIQIIWLALEFAPRRFLGSDGVWNTVGGL
jgi:hypothetical protein